MNHYVVLQHKYSYVNILYLNYKKNIWCRATNTKEKQEEKETNENGKTLYNRKNQLRNYFDEIINHIN